MGDKRQSRRSRSQPAALLGRIDELASDTRLSAAEIHRELLADPDLSERVPSVRTVRDLVNESRASSDDERWELTPEEPAHSANAILQVLAELWLSTNQRYPLTQRQARWIGLLAETSPGIPPIDMFRLAVRFVRLERRDLTRGERAEWESLEFFLASRPWESLPLAEGYLRSADAYGLTPFHMSGSRGIAPDEASPKTEEESGA